MNEEKEHKNLIRQLLDPNIPKSDMENAAREEIIKLRKELGARKKHLRDANKGARINALALEASVDRVLRLQERIEQISKGGV